MGRWGDGEMGRWGDGEVGRWGDGEMGVQTSDAVASRGFPPLAQSMADNDDF
ncbi:MAG: hypothetical protein F6K49_18655 [Moorea sp. SIO3I6]|nr:hypothetical protein [Moorena sp. SIO3I6]